MRPIGSWIPKVDLGFVRIRSVIFCLNCPIEFADENSKPILLHDFIEEIKFDRLGVFLYSEEDGTYGQEAFNDDVPIKIKKVLN